MTDEAPETVDGILREAVALKASDIYWIPGKDSFSVLCKVDGVQRKLRSIDPATGLQCATRLKVMAQLLSYRSQVAQDGVIRDAAAFPGIEFRVAIMPTVHGERVNLRLVDKSSGPKRLDELNFEPNILAKLKDMLRRPSGLIILTGPTGCGKTTTIYAMLRELLKDSGEDASIISIEDPVESLIDGISQVSLSKANAEWNYQLALRAALRQDIKTLVIGEMRDPEVVKVALDAALTGHRVISSFHAGDIPSVYARILHQGFEPFLVASTISGILSQRLLPMPSGSGRIPLAAALVPDDSWRDFILTEPSLAELRKRIESIPEASLQAAANSLCEKRRIEVKEAQLS